MLRIWILFGTVYAVSGAYTYTRPAVAPVSPPATNKFQPSVLPAPPASFVSNDFSHNISFVITAKYAHATFDLLSVSNLQRFLINSRFFFYRGLPSKTLDTIDPYFKVYETSKTQVEPKKIGQTEVINDSPDAEFATVIWFSWKKGTNQVNFKRFCFSCIFLKKMPACVDICRLCDSN